MRGMKTHVFAVAALLTAASVPFSAQAPSSSAINDRIRAEEARHSEIMQTLHVLADVHGPRLTGSPNHKAAAQWAVEQMTRWGFTNGHLEPWDFGHPGWSNEHLEVHMTAPVHDALVVEALAWTPGTNGTISAPAVNLVAPEGPDVPSNPDAPAARGGRGPARLGPTSSELQSYLDGVREKVHGAAVLVGKPVFVPVSLDPPPGRMTDQAAHCRYDPGAANDPACQNQGRGRGFRGGAARAGQPADRLTPRQVSEQIDKFLVANKALLRVNDAGRSHGQIAAFNNPTYDPAQAVATVVMRNEDYGRIARLLADGTPVTIEAAIVNKVYPEGKTSYNAIAEIPGTDKKDEVVMLGGHLDSWHSATGATDNAIGCAVMMEAARLLKAAGVQPRRTIRVALWSGEEEGLLGSLAYVRQHFGTAEAPKPEFATFNGYLNVDSGTGRVRGASVFGPDEDANILREALASFTDLKFEGVMPTRSRATGGTDSTSFNNAGLPGIGFGQDPIEYSSHTHHTNLDTYERIIEQDVRDSAVVIAAALYELAMSDQMLPRFPAGEMPPPVAAR
jgi:carboxypeptidase Q